MYAFYICQTLPGCICKLLRSSALLLLGKMCIRVVERYAACHCIYHIHGVDACSSYGRHPVTDRVIYVGYSCPRHDRPPPTSHDDSGSDHNTTLEEWQRPSSLVHNLRVYQDQSEKIEEERLNNSAPAHFSGTMTTILAARDSEETSDTDGEASKNVDSK